MVGNIDKRVSPSSTLRQVWLTSLQLRQFAGCELDGRTRIPYFYPYQSDNCFDQADQGGDITFSVLANRICFNFALVAGIAKFIFPPFRKSPKL